MTMNAVLRKKIEQARVSVTSYPKLSILAATHARETASRQADDAPSERSNGEPN